MAKSTDYQYGGADYDPTSMSPMRPGNQNAPDMNTFQEGGADSVAEMGRAEVKPPYANPSGGEMQLGGADELPLGQNPGWPWEQHVGKGVIKPL